MATINIALERGVELVNVPIAVEVVDSNLETRWKGAITLGGSGSTDDLQPGRYAIQAKLPSGETLTSICDLKEGTTGQVQMDVIGWSPRESLEWTKITRPEALAAVPRPPAQGLISEAAPVQAGKREEHLRSVWLRLWSRETDGRWGVRPWPVQHAEREPGLVQYTFRFRTEDQRRQYYLQVGGPTMQWRLTALPADDIRVLVTSAQPHGLRNEADSPVDVAVASTNFEAEVLLGYLARGGVDQAQLVCHAIAERLLHEKSQNPIAAAVAGYFLLGTASLERAHQLWARNLADWTPWLPDGSVIDAWYLLRMDKPDVVQARRRLIEAATRGTPVYTRGLRLLLDGLASFNEDPDHRGWDIHAALERVRGYASAVDWRSATVSFIGQDPYSPGTISVGFPEDPTHVIFVADPSEEDLAWKARRTVQSVLAAGVRWDGARAETVPTPVRQELRGAALGETVETQGLVESPTARPEDLPVIGPDAAARYRARAAQRTAQVAELRASSAVESDTTERQQRRIARLLRAASAQTQAERMADVNPVALLPEAQHPAHLHGLALDRVLGRSDLLSVSFLAQGLAAARAVGRVTLLAPNGTLRGYATGFLVSPRLLLTPNHVLPNPALARSSVVEFDYQDGPDGRLLSPTRLSLDPTAFFVTEPELDCSLIAVGGPEPGRAFGWIRLTDELGKVLVGERLSVIQHANGAPKQVALREQQLIDTVENFLHYQGDTATLGSGAPLFNDQWEFVAMHHAGVPARDDQGHILSVDGSPWTVGMQPDQIQWIANEGLRGSRVVRFLRELTLSGQQAELRDELLYSRLPAEATVCGSPTPDIPRRPEPHAELTTTARELRRRKGYDPAFLGTGYAVPLPEFGPDLASQAVVIDPKASGEERYLLKYTHFTIAMHRDRRMAIYAAANLDMGRSHPVKQSRKVWGFDPRLPREQQTGYELYDGSDLVLGPLIHRLQPAWGPLAEARRAEADTYFFSNAVPQPIGFRQAAWLELEDRLLGSVDTRGFQACVFTGPVFSNADPAFYGTRVPRALWKVVVLIHHQRDALTATGYLCGLPERPARLEPSAVPTGIWQVPLVEIERRAGLRFGELNRFDPLAGGSAQPVEALAGEALPL